MVRHVDFGLTHVESSHKCQFIIDEKKLFMMRPVQNNVIGHAVDGANGILSCLGQVKVGKIAKGLFKFRRDIIAVWDMIWMSENVDIWMEGFKSMFRVLYGVSCRSPKERDLR